MVLGDNWLYSSACYFLIIHSSHACVKPKTAKALIEEEWSKSSSQDYPKIDSKLFLFFNLFLFGNPLCLKITTIQLMIAKNNIKVTGTI